MSIITCFGDRTSGFFLGLSDRDNAVSRTDNFVDVFNSVTSPPFILFGLKPEVGGIKIVSHCLQTIHFPS